MPDHRYASPVERWLLWVELGCEYAPQDQEDHGAEDNGQGGSAYRDPEPGEGVCEAHDRSCVTE